jgi:hypothetical protein
MTLPSIVAPGIRSFMRFRHRSNVLLPQPDAPIIATISFFGTAKETSLTASAPL